MIFIPSLAVCLVRVCSFLGKCRPTENPVDEEQAMVSEELSHEGQMLEHIEPGLRWMKESDNGIFTENGGECFFHSLFFETKDESSDVCSSKEAVDIWRLTLRCLGPYSRDYGDGCEQQRGTY